ncbi:MAG: hypothetical protein JSS64_11595 [Bacteroidetes bacterium]|nr:hypothetical protein [Bacteroidota bacterium]
MIQHNEKENKLVFEWVGTDYNDLYNLQWDILELLKQQTDAEFLEAYWKNNGRTTYFTVFDFLQKTLIDISDLK